MSALVKHIHRAVPALGREHCFTGPIPGAKENRRAHGCVTCVDTCRCGAVRSMNINFNNIEEGPWEPPAST